MLAVGALAGLLVGLLAQAAIDGVDEDIRGLVRIALLLPAGVFVGWWLLVPGMGVDADEVEPGVDARIDVEARVERIEAAFDDQAVPRMGLRPTALPDAAIREELRGTIRRPGASEDPARFGIRRAPAPGERVDNG